jgi:hypothetical protein
VIDSKKYLYLVLDMSKSNDKNNSGHIISQYAAAKIAGVTRQALNNMFKREKSTFAFFTKDGQVDSSHPHWLAYLKDRGAKSGNNNSQRPGKKKREDKDEKESSLPKASGWDRDHALTGGYDPALFVPTTAAQLKALTDIVARNLEIRIKLGDLLPREVVDLYLDNIAQGVNQFVALGRSVSTDICEKLDRVGMEREVEKMINPKVKNIIEQIIESCNNAKK